MANLILKCYYKIAQFLLRVGFKLARITKKYHLRQEILRIDLRTYSRLEDGVNLSKKQLDEISNYWSQFVKVCPFSHVFYSEKTGVYSPYYLPDSIYYFLIDQFYNNWEVGKIVDNKCFYPQMFSGIKMPVIIASRKNRYWYDGVMNMISEETVRELVMNADGVFIKKANESMGGKGVFYFNSRQNSAEDLKNILSSINTDIVIQKGLKQSETLEILNPSSVNTLRFLSLLRKDGSVKVYSVILRMGVGDSKVDNASSGGITCGVQPDGRLKSVAYNPLGIKFEEHPTSHVHFDQIMIPGYHEIKKKIEMLHVQVPHFRLVSWDIAIDSNNEPVLIEANLYCGELDFHQLNNGPLFGEDTDDILREVFNK